MNGLKFEFRPGQCFETVSSDGTPNGLVVELGSKSVRFEAAWICKIVHDRTGEFGAGKEFCVLERYLDTGIDRLINEVPEQYHVEAWERAGRLCPVCKKEVIHIMAWRLDECEDCHHNKLEMEAAEAEMAERESHAHWMAAVGQEQQEYESGKLNGPVDPERLEDVHIPIDTELEKAFDVIVHTEPADQDIQDYYTLKAYSELNDAIKTWVRDLRHSLTHGMLKGVYSIGFTGPHPETEMLTLFRLEALNPSESTTMTPWRIVINEEENPVGGYMYFDDALIQLGKLLRKMVFYGN